MLAHMPENKHSQCLIRVKGSLIFPKEKSKVEGKEGEGTAEQSDWGMYSGDFPPL